MNRKTAISAAIAVLGILGLGSTAQAGMIPIPCTGDRIVEVREIPIEKQIWSDHVVHLGYKFPGCFGQGEWIGYTGDNSSYVRLDDRLRALMFQRAGYTTPPSEPSRFDYWLQTFALEIFIAALLSASTAWVLIQERIKSRRAVRNASA
jgi:hypothetical protein